MKWFHQNVVRVHENNDYNTLTIVYIRAKRLVFSMPPIAMGANILACHTKRMWRPGVRQATDSLP